MTTWAWVSSTKRIRPESKKNLLRIVEEQNRTVIFSLGSDLAHWFCQAWMVRDTVTSYAYVSWKQPLVNTDLTSTSCSLSST